MNRRLPRFAIFVVLLITMLGVAQGGGLSPNLVRAEGPSCDKYRNPDYEMEPAEGNFEASRLDTPEVSQSALPGALFDLNLLENGEFAILYPPEVIEERGGDLVSTILRIDTGVVTVFNCNPENSIYVYPDSGRPEAPQEVMAGGDALVGEGGAVFVNAGDAYYLQEGDHQQNASAEGVQQLNNELSTDALAPGNAKGGGSSGSDSKLCSGGGCKTGP